MVIATGKVTSNLPAKVHSPTLDSELTAAFGPGIGWTLEYDGEKNIAGIRYEFDQALGYDTSEVGAFFKAYVLAPGSDDDFEASAKLAERERQDKEGVATLLQRVSDLEQRVTALEGDKG